MSVPTLHAACAYFDVDLDDVTGSTRTNRVCRARAAVAYVMRNRDGISLPQIGKRLGGRDHSTIMNALRQANDVYQLDPHFTAFLVAQMALPRHSPRAALFELIQRETVMSSLPNPAVAPPPPEPAPEPVAAPPSPAPEPARRPKFKRPRPKTAIQKAEEDGICLQEYQGMANVIAGSRSLADALRRQHPERFA